MTHLNSELPKPDFLSIAVRTYADHGKRKPFNEPPYIPSKYTLTFDCETTTDETQALRFGVFQLREDGEIIQQGLFYDSQTLNPEELELLKMYAVNNSLVHIPIEEFVEEYIYKFGYDLGAAIVGFNLSFDLSRLAQDWGVARKFMKGGFTLRLSDDKRRPNIAVKHISSRIALMRFVGPFVQRTGRGMRKRKARVPFERGTFIDVRTLAAALLSKSFTLGKLSEHLQVQHQKLETDEHGGHLTEDYLHYAVRDVQTTWECFVALSHKYNGLKLVTPIHKIMSEASLGKAYLSQMGIKPWRECQPDFPPELIGKIFSTYFGGRSEVHIRGKIQRVMYCDFLSMYPTVCTKMGLWKFVIAEGMTWRIGKEEIQKFLDLVNVDDFKDPETWKKLTVIVRLKPDTERLPIRAEYAEGAGTSIGLNHLSSDRSLYFTLADCIASKLLTGKVPMVEEAIIFEAGAAQTGLEPVEVGGHADCLVDPYNDDFYKKLIELRQATKAKLKKASGVEAWQLDAAQLALKIAANATSYGIFVEIIVRDELKKRNITCYGFDGAFITNSNKTEQPGRYFHPLLATLITGAARLLLALVECKVIEEEVDWALCDTDSMAIARPEGMEEGEFVDKAKAICAWFDELNPYEGGGPLLKIEDDNYSLEDSKALAELYCLAVSSKRYALFNMLDGKPVIRKVSAHGLGHLLEPYDDRTPAKEIPRPKVDLKEARHWHHDLWYHIILAELEGHGAQVNMAWHPALKKPAMSQYRASSPDLLAWFKSLNHGKSYRDAVKPFNFLLTQVAGSDALKSSVKAVAPYDKNYDRALRKAFDRVTGRKVNPADLQSYVQALAQYHLHPESKFHNGDFVDQGQTSCRNTRAMDFRYIGKEADRLEERYFGVLEDDSEIVYSAEGGMQGVSGSQLITMAKGIKIVEIARRTGLSPKHVSNILKGTSQGSRSTRTRIVKFLNAFAMNPEPES
ncbi:MAG: hypothetical protein ABIN69_10935 [Aestuariivirga sp.]